MHEDYASRTPLQKIFREKSPKIRLKETADALLIEEQNKWIEYNLKALLSIMRKVSVGSTGTKTRKKLWTGRSQALDRNF